MNSLETAPLQRLLATTEKLIYANGITSTGVDLIARESGVSRKTIYDKFSTKEGLIAEVLRQRDQRWMSWFVASSSKVTDPRERLLSTFDALEEWFFTPDFNGCAFINAAGEMGNTSAVIYEVSKQHKINLLEYLESIALEMGVKDPKRLAMDFLLLLDGAITLAKVMGNKHAAKNGKFIAKLLLENV